MCVYTYIGFYWNVVLDISYELMNKEQVCKNFLMIYISVQPAIVWFFLMRKYNVKLQMGWRWRFLLVNIFLNRYKPRCSSRCRISPTLLSWRPTLTSNGGHWKWYIIVLHELHLCLSAEDHQLWNTSWHLSTFKWDWLSLALLIYLFLFCMPVQERILCRN